jgi:hypothetical protein
MRWLYAATVLVLAGCSPDPRDTQIVSRIKSPDGRLEAIYADDIGGGAAVGTTEEVFVVEPGRTFPRLSERVFSAECARAVNVAWEGPRTLRIAYKMAPDLTGGPGVQPSLFSIFSSGYWIDSHPHGVQLRFSRSPPPDGASC